MHSELLFRENWERKFRCGLKKNKSDRWCTQMLIFRVLIGTWLIFLMSCSSLQELQKANLKRQQDAHARMKDQYVTLEKPSDTNVKVSGDGLKIDSAHYSLSLIHI